MTLPARVLSGSISARGRRCTRSGIRVGITQPEDDAPLVLGMSDVDVRLPDVSFEILERQDVIDFGVITADCRAERAGSRSRDDCGRLLEPIEELAESATPSSVNATPVPAIMKTAAAIVVILFILNLPSLE